mgnify:CR=1 FL=1
MPQRLAERGRNGLGTVVVQSAGNSFDFGDDTNLHAFQNSRYIVTVGATGPTGEVSGYSSPGASVLVVRPGFVRTAMTTHLDDGPMATTPEAVAADIVSGLRSGAHTVWSPAKLRYVFAVLRHLPRPVWRRVAASK